MQRNLVNWFEIYMQDMACAGGHVIREKMSIGQYGFILLASDTEDNMFGLYSSR